MVNYNLVLGVLGLLQLLGLVWFTLAFIDSLDLSRVCFQLFIPLSDVRIGLPGWKVSLSLSGLFSTFYTIV